MDIPNDVSCVLVIAACSAAAGLWELGVSERNITIRALWSTVGYSGTMGAVIAAGGLAYYSVAHFWAIFAVSVGTVLGGRKGMSLVSEGMLAKVWDAIAEVIIKMRQNK